MEREENRMMTLPEEYKYRSLEERPRYSLHKIGTGQDLDQYHA